ncbi:hypothetical protein [Jiangella alkaliphila]|uniref:hypothetical protein n=1 Tax=Jiangella alkaliphila TaxID=419479 RepID=UPI0006998853|nr:hypothetical protein [Jiangella alkaliphila]
MNRVLTAAAAAAVLLLAGCGDDVPATGGDDPTEEVTPTGDPSGSPTSPTDPTTPTGDPTDLPSDDPSGLPTDPGTTPPSDTPVPQPTTTPGSLQLSGFPTPGVESGCWLLDGYLLMGGDQELISSGREVQITGEAQPGILTTCQQGTPFRVDSVVAIEP